MRILFRVAVGLVLFLSAAVCVSYAKDWETLKGSNFVIYYRASVPESFVNTVMDSAEDDLKQVSENLGISHSQRWSSSKRVSIYIYADEKDYVTNGGQMGWSHGAALISSRTIKTYPADQGFFDAILPHELSHIIFREFVGVYADIPLWFDEGIAMYQEKARHIGANKIVQEALTNGQFISLNQMTDMRLYNNSDREKIELFYAESASIVNFMMTQLGENHFYKFCRELKENADFSKTLSKIYIRINNLDDLNKKWVDYLKGR